MSDEHEQQREHGGSSMMSWFWIGAGIGFFLSAAAIAVAAEATYRRRFFTTPRDFAQSEVDLVEDLSDAVYDGLQTLIDAAESLTHDFGTASRERIRFGLDPQHGGASSHSWYTGDEE